MLPFYAAAIGAFAYSTMAQTQTSSFDLTRMKLDNISTGQVLPIFFTSGDGTDVSITFGNTSWQEPVACMSSWLNSIEIIAS